MTTEERFWSYVKKGDGCWMWTSALNRNGYGRFVTGKERILAHRYAFALSYGAVLPGFLVCHRCDQRRCVRPDHLFVGTQSDNMIDCVRKGRHVNAKPGRAALTPRVMELRGAGVLQREIAAELNVPLSFVKDVCLGRTRYAGRFP